jgi:transposase InsO family protein
MTYHANARTNIQQRTRIRQSRDPYRVQAKQLGVSVATVAKWTDRDNPHDRTSRPHRIPKALPPEAAPLLTWLRRDWLADLDSVWLALRQTVFPQLSRSAVYRELVRLDLHQLRTLRPQAARCPGKFRACPPGFLHVDVFYLPRLDGRRRYLFVAIDRATRLLTMQVYETRTTASALAFVAHCQRFYPFRLYRFLTDNGKEFTLRGYRGRGGATTAKVHPFTQACRHAKIRHSLIKAYHPWTNGLAERTGSTIKTETVYRLHFDTSAQLFAALYGFERYFNYHRPYKAMGGKTPYQLTQQWYVKASQWFLRDPTVLFTTW